MAFKPKPYDGHWWGTQPAKTPRQLPNVPWEGTTQSLQTLTNALGDGSPEIRATAAQAFRQFMLSEAPVAASPGPKEAALAALRSRLQAESEPPVRQALIEALATQRDALAMPVFTTIARDEKAEPAFRKSVISAITAIGGDEATKTIAQLASAPLPKPVLVVLLEAVAKLKVIDAAPALIGRLHEGGIDVREKMIRALAALGPKSGATLPFMELLNDQEGRIRMEAMNGLEKLKDKAALPSLLARAEPPKAGKPMGDNERRTLIRAIGAVADATAIPVLLDALKGQPDSRRDALKALKALRAEAWPMIEQRLASGEIPAELEAEIRRTFDSGAIAKWKIIGPFENVWGAVHPPEAEALASKGALDLSRKYKSSDGKEVGWREVSGEGEQSRIDLGKMLQANGMDSAYAYAEIEAPEASAAEILSGSDDQIAIWLNGEKILDVPGSRGFSADADKVPVQLAAGTNRLLVKIGNQSGTWEFAARVPGLQGTRFVKSNQPAADAKQRAFALAIKADGAWLHAGDPVNGAKLFHDPSAGMGAICATCHIAEGKGGQIGPNLSSIGTNYKRADLITSILEPAKTIALGYEQVAIETKSGETVAGSLRSETGDALTVLTADGQTHVIKKPDVKTNTHLPTSLMPPGLAASLRPEEFVDLLAYLEGLRGQ
jgi:putative heme-binding domain-containing protein